MLYTSARAARQLRPFTPRYQCLRSAPRQTTIRTIASSLPNHEPSSTEERKRLAELAEERRQYYKRRSIYSGIGFVGGMIAIWFLATTADFPPKPHKLDSSSTTPGHDKRHDDPLVNIGREKKAVVQRMGESADENSDVVETGNSTVPTFPRLIEFDDVHTEEDKRKVREFGATEYQLMGLGVRTVSFLGLQVYVVGMYCATDDIAKLQQELVRKIDPIATTLVAGEKENLKAKLLDPKQGEEVWSSVLKEAGIRTVFRIVPVRDTDFNHMRDAYVRAVVAQGKKHPEEFEDDRYGQSVAQLKNMFGKGKVPKRKELVLARNEKGVLSSWYDDGKHGAQRLGSVDDERISRALWLHYLAGKHVASPAARDNIINGIMEFVERPVGTMATKVRV
jgi:hypothetical protein